MDQLLQGLRAAGEATRLRILGLCAHAELTVTELVEILDQSQPRISRHLRLLVEAGLLRRAGEVLFGERAGAVPEPGGLLIFEDAFALAEPAVREALEPWVARLEARLGRGRPVTIGEPGGGLEVWMWRFRQLQAREIWAAAGLNLGPGQDHTDLVRWLEQTTKTELS